MRRPLLRAKTQAGDGWIPPAKVAVVGKEVLRQCDALDGLADGLVSNYVACNAGSIRRVTPKALGAGSLCRRRRHRRHLSLGRADRAADAVHAADGVSVRTRQGVDDVRGLGDRQRVRDELEDTPRQADAGVGEQRHAA